MWCFGFTGWCLYDLHCLKTTCPYKRNPLKFTELSRPLHNCRHNTFSYKQLPLNITSICLIGFQGTGFALISPGGYNGVPELWRKQLTITICFGRLWDASIVF